MSNQPNIERLQKLASYLRTLKPEQWDYSLPTLKSCQGTPCGCALVHSADVFPAHLDRDMFGYTRVRHSRSNYLDTYLEDFYGLSSSQSRYLFEPKAASNALDEHATASQVADHIERFIASL